MLLLETHYGDFYISYAQLCAKAGHFERHWLGFLLLKLGVFGCRT